MQYRFEGPYGFASGEWRNPLRGVAQPIVYRLRTWKDDGSGPRPINRAAGVDEEGVLDIGESSDGARRLSDLLAACKGVDAPNRAGLSYAPGWYDFASVFPIATLRIDFIRLASKQLAEAVELDLLEDYRGMLKDRPPLNGSDGKQKAVARWLRWLGPGAERRMASAR